MPIAPNAIDHPQPIAVLLGPARPLPAAPQHPRSNHPQTGDAQSPHIEAFYRSAAAEVRGVIGSTATVGGNAAHIGAPGVAGIAQGQGRQYARDAIEAIGRHVDRRA